jgi:hypothetical protein
VSAELKENPSAPAVNRGLVVQFGLAFKDADFLIQLLDLPFE